MLDQALRPVPPDYGRISASSRINELIYRCFDYISPQDQHKFVSKFRNQPHDSDQVMHTLRELVLGAYLGSHGFATSHEYPLGNKTPDWCLFDCELSILGIIELMNFNLDAATAQDVESQLDATGLACVWRDQNTDNVDRLYHSIWQKAQTYRDLAAHFRIAYVVAVFGTFRAALDFEEVTYCLVDEEFGLFREYPVLSGLLYFEEQHAAYRFQYLQNPSALSVLELPGGVFPPGVA